jgi:hypothetical protein
MFLKVSLFNHGAFETALAPILFASLRDGTTEQLASFIDQRWQECSTSIGEDAEPLEEDWRDTEPVDVQHYGEIAVSVFVVADATPLAYGWDALAAYLASLPAFPDARAVVCGTSFGPAKRVFDPGAMGTGLVNASVARGVSARLAQLTEPPPGPESGIYDGCYSKPEKAAEVVECLRSARTNYAEAVANACGLLLTF